MPMRSSYHKTRQVIREKMLAESLSNKAQLLRSFGQTTPFSISGGESTTIPFDFSQNVPVVTLNVNGVAAKFLVDTTVSDFVYVDLSLAAKSKIGTVALPTVSLGQVPHVSMGRVENLKFGS